MSGTFDYTEGIWLARARDRDAVEYAGEKVTLLFWRNRKARIQFANGRVRTVDTADINVATVAR